MNNDIMSALMGALNNPEAKEKIMDTISTLGNNSDNSKISEEPPVSSSQNNGGIDTEMLFKIKNLVDNFNRTDDPRIGLLNSIRPYMKNKRNSNIDMAIRFIQIINFIRENKNVSHL